MQIKIAQPNVWISKGAWVYMETHPWEDFSEKSHYIFLDGNSRNFSPDNIERVPFKIMPIFGNLGGRVQGNPDLTRLNIARAKLISARLDAGERLGLTLRQGRSRIFREEANNRMRIYRSDPERRKLINERAREYYRRVKSENPHKSAINAFSSASLSADSVCTAGGLSANRSCTCAFVIAKSI